VLLLELPDDLGATRAVVKGGFGFAFFFFFFQV
jgi:hypothetical protein